MRVLLLRSLGGHAARTIVDQDQAAAEWLLAAGLAAAAPVRHSTSRSVRNSGDFATAASGRHWRALSRHISPAGGDALWPPPHPVPGPRMPANLTSAREPTSPASTSSRPAPWPADAA